ncbi:hypothetical protein EWM64_g4419 [Hericium alpestre]|uniref:Peptidase A1 domain-containing protein n=1 Tax=Hericium alpestre TaxID=135208 RepID=A0A4Y9ZXS1_9AGAM|nr:hypothetical protein EWM64_g4419 [Hericium alpestre]
MTGFPIGVAHTLTGELANSHGAGIAGFTNGKIDKPTRTGGITLLEGLRESGLIPRSVIGIQMVRGQNGAAGTGRVTLGGADSSKFQTGAGSLVRMANQGHTGLWAVRLGDIKVNGQTVRSNLDTILDTDSGRHLWLACDHTKIPTMTFQVGSAVFTLNPVDIVGMKIGNRGLCYSLIQELPAGRAQWNLGIPFMKAAYQILDSDANEITLAKYAG